MPRPGATVDSRPPERRYQSVQVAAEADERMGDMVEILVLRALALQTHRDLPTALAVLATALRLAAAPSAVSSAPSSCGLPT